MQLKGILPALVTPFDTNGNVDHDALAKLLEYQLSCGVHGFVACGTTGEAYALTAEERVGVLKTVKEVVGNRGTLIAGANGACTREVIENASRARELGYEAVLLAPPYYALPSQEELIAYYQAVLDAVDVNLVLYNYPVRVVVEVGMEVLEAFRGNDRVISIKESSGNLLRAIEIGTRFTDDYQLSCGSDDQALDFFIWGASSWICGPANFCAPQVVDFYNKFTAGDIAGAKQAMEAIFPAMANLESGKFIQKVKYGCELAGVPVGPTRAPLLPLTDAEKADFRKAFELIQG